MQVGNNELCRIERVGVKKTRGYIKKIARFDEKSLQNGDFRQLFGIPNK